ncbi:hydroxymethylglutaryl-CoA lyase [Alicyclobacillus sp.]|uniref:hydroxymethylglutaryl-CoA lyase n=1 Tax=Alicyclobacillus sp. TaxID=61169 RepID=UPI0025C2055B|nr:hydroxymethylglutaryl-CoA lyase [Alicyclobacillus sp.]MCL6517025.1 hydroxymethylglutaryl-CoA lyase [Alicyclobacillus sp.]
MSRWPKTVRVIDVTPRDGLQDAKGTLRTEDKVRLIDELYQAGVPEVEVTSFVSPRWVPKLADAEAVAQAVRHHPGNIALIPNQKGFHRAAAAGLRAVTFVVSASLRHQRDNLRMPLERSLEALAEIAKMTGAATAPTPDHGAVPILRGAISCAFGSPWADEEIPPDAVARVARALADRGVIEIGLADTVGVGTPERVADVIDAVQRAVPGMPLVLHLHDRWGIALANVTVALERGVSRFETALGGLGGCPFAPNAPGNLDTESFVGWMERMGVETGVDRAALARTRTWLLEALRRSEEEAQSISEHAPHSDTAPASEAT